MQNQNEETPAVYHLKDTNSAASPGQYSKETLSPATAAGSSSGRQQQQLEATAAGSSSGRLGSRLTKSASWFNSLSRRRVSSTGGGGKPPLKKRSFAAFNASHRADDSFATPSRPRLNK